MCMLTNVISSFVPKKSTVLRLMSWKHSFKRLNEEYEIANKKKQALDKLFETGRISQTTRDSFNDEIDAAVADIEKQQKELLAKMQFKMGSLETQIKTLEMLLANYEIQHVVGEIEEEAYAPSSTLGLIWSAVGCIRIIVHLSVKSSEFPQANKKTNLCPRQRPSAKLARAPSPGLVDLGRCTYSQRLGG